MPTYDRPVDAELHVHLSTGETWTATAADLEKFRLMDPGRGYERFDTALADALDRHQLLPHDLTDAELNPVRDLVETAACHPDLLDHPEQQGWRAVADLEQRLRRNPPAGDAEGAEDRVGQLERHIERLKHYVGTLADQLGVQVSSEQLDSSAGLHRAGEEAHARLEQIVASGRAD